MSDLAIAGLAAEAAEELRSAIKKFPPLHSGHEGYAVIKEELDELWERVMAGQPSHGSARQEAIQVAAMALRYVLDLCMEAS